MITDIEARINEAEVCRSMGLYGDSLDIYERILSLVDPQDDHVQATIIVWPLWGAFPAT